MGCEGYVKIFASNMPKALKKLIYSVYNDNRIPDNRIPDNLDDDKYYGTNWREYQEYKTEVCIIVYYEGGTQDNLLLVSEIDDESINDLNTAFKDHLGDDLIEDIEEAAQYYDYYVVDTLMLWT
jgi:hypothetical protein